MTERRQFLKYIVSYFAALPIIKTPAGAEPVAPLPEELIDVQWFRAASDLKGGPIFAEAKFRINGGEWITKRNLPVTEHEHSTLFALTETQGIETNGNWRANQLASAGDEPECVFMVDRMEHFPSFYELPSPNWFSYPPETFVCTTPPT